MKFWRHSRSPAATWAHVTDRRPAKADFGCRCEATIQTWILVTLRGEYFNRRSNVLNPDESLLLRKPLMEVAHGGGRRLQHGDPTHQVLREWIAEGMKVEPEGAPTLARIELLPSPRVLRDGAERQQLIVNGYFSDGTVRDITALTSFDSSDESIGVISPAGVVSSEGRGEVTVLARYLDKVSTTQLTFLTERPDFQWPNPPEETKIDQLVFRKLKQLQIQPSELVQRHGFSASRDTRSDRSPADPGRIAECSSRTSRRQNALPSLIGCWQAMIMLGSGR